MTMWLFDDARCSCCRRWPTERRMQRFDWRWSDAKLAEQHTDTHTHSVYSKQGRDDSLWGRCKLAHRQQLNGFTRNKMSHIKEGITRGSQNNDDDGDGDDGEALIPKKPTRLIRQPLLLFSSISIRLNESYR